MARYDYRCSVCGKVFEVVHGMTEKPSVSCPECGGACEKVFTPTLIEFKGSGFYNTDQRGGSPAASPTSASGGSDAGAAAAAAPAETKAAHPCENCPHKDE